MPTAPLSHLDVKPLIRRHAGDASFYWAQHDAALGAPQIDFENLVQFDRLLEAHLDGVIAGRESGWAVALAEFERWLGPGEAFVCARLAARLEEDDRFEALWPLVEKQPDRSLRGIISALVWEGDAADQARLDRWMMHPPHPLAQVAALRAAALRRLPMTPDRTAAVLSHFASASADVRAAACRLAASSVDARFIPELTALLNDASDVVRAEAAIALASRGHPAGTASTLWVAVFELAQELQTRKGWPLKQGMRRLTRWVQHLALMVPPGHADLAALFEHLPTRVGLIFALYHGDPAHLDRVLACLDDPIQGPFAGWVWGALTGVDLEEHGLALELNDDVPIDPPEQGPDAYDLGLPKPDAAAIRQRHQRLAQAFEAGVPILHGRPFSVEHCLELLTRAAQAQRWIANHRLRRFGLDGINIGARGVRQLEQLDHVRRLAAATHR